MNVRYNFTWFIKFELSGFDSSLHRLGFSRSWSQVIEQGEGLGSRISRKTIVATHLGNMLWGYMSFKVTQTFAQFTTKGTTSDLVPSLDASWTTATQGYPPWPSNALRFSDWPSYLNTSRFLHIYSIQREEYKQNDCPAHIKGLLGVQIDQIHTFEGLFRGLEDTIAAKEVLEDGLVTISVKIATLNK